MRVESGLFEEIGSELRLLEEEVPELSQESSVNDCENGKEVVLEGAYVVFSVVESEYVWGYDLVSDIPVPLDDTLVFGTDFVINIL